MLLNRLHASTYQNIITFAWNTIEENNVKCYKYPLLMYCIRSINYHQANTEVTKLNICMIVVVIEAGHKKHSGG